MLKQIWEKDGRSLLVDEQENLLAYNENGYITICKLPEFRSAINILKEVKNLLNSIK